MGKENGEWILHGIRGPGQIRTPEELEEISTDDADNTDDTEF